MKTADEEEVYHDKHHILMGYFVSAWTLILLSPCKKRLGEIGASLRIMAELISQLDDLILV
ncbi:MAG TPA: hypothetical protein DCR61_09125 [Verrucomicrobiales bacterium]|nr:hypothetical protein [Pedosphaera sp.]HAQ99501.1 hypothetical protein [Verrucomicrobiales bacterium]HAW03020.1 hypothetical protein [Verrucomicrobiales bacterium]HBP55588.1 hypothetical protein [Verrucomicrobiales bacterium]HCZ04742.1 hypothetical protein [Verrucomicrobiales bacterium]